MYVYIYILYTRRGFQGYGFRLSAKDFETPREVDGLVIFVSLRLRLGAP